MCLFLSKSKIIVAKKTFIFLKVPQKVIIFTSIVIFPIISSYFFQIKLKKLHNMSFL
jgi:hypothetical protein